MTSYSGSPVHTTAHSYITIHSQHYEQVTHTVGIYSLHILYTGNYEPKIRELVWNTKAIMRVTEMTAA